MCACGPFPQIKTLSPLAIMYNDISVLENHHAATTYRSAFATRTRAGPAPCANAR
jgi:hypothetical protein